MYCSLSVTTVQFPLSLFLMIIFLLFCNLKTAYIFEIQLPLSRRSKRLFLCIFCTAFFNISSLLNRLLLCMFAILIFLLP